MGGAMAVVADRTSLHVRVLNTSKGPAVQAKRSQQDKGLYALVMKETLELQPNLELLQDEAIGLEIDANDQVSGVLCRSAGRIQASAVVITAGTFLRAAVISGESRTAGARAGDRADADLGAGLLDLGFQLRRLKTGTPPRVDGTTLDLNETERQHGSDTPVWLSREGELGRIEPLCLPPLAVHVDSASAWRTQLACLKTATQPETHDIIRANLHRAPMFNGSIEGIGPRYCPSIEDKVARFVDKESHPIFLEPEGWRTTEYYVQGMSTSLPPEIQELAIRTIPGMHRARLTRYGYAVEYDAVDPIELSTTLESRRIAGLFLAGQINGTSGYEEAAGQGILAGMNAAAVAHGRPQTTLSRSQAYIGVMVDDLANRPFDEPYRMLTSRCEYRLLLRPDTARDRLSELAYQHGLIELDRLNDGQGGANRAHRNTGFARTRSLSSHVPNTRPFSLRFDLGPVSKPMSAAELLRRPNTDYALVAAVARQLDSELPPSILVSPDRIESDHPLRGIPGTRIKRSHSSGRASGLSHFQNAFDYREVPGLRIEAIEQAGAAQTAYSWRGRTFGRGYSVRYRRLTHLFARTERSTVPA